MVDVKAIVDKILQVFTEISAGTISAQILFNMITDQTRETNTDHGWVSSVRGRRGSCH